MRSCSLRNEPLSCSEFVAIILCEKIASLRNEKEHPNLTMLYNVIEKSVTYNILCAERQFNYSNRGHTKKQEFHINKSSRVWFSEYSCARVNIFFLASTHLSQGQHILKSVLPLYSRTSRTIKISQYFYMIR